MMKLLTIAIPTYNRKQFLMTSLKSIYSQIDERVEVIVSDNCSTDDTGNFVKENYPNVLYYRNESNVGMENFQRCYKRASGKYIWLLGDDDIITEGSLRGVLEFLENNEDLSLIFLNHATFKGTYNGVENCDSPFFDAKFENLVTNDKTRFINIARYQLTFISCFLISNKEYKSINNPDKYNKSYFLQTCIAFEVSKDENAKLGIISRVCVARNGNPPELVSKPLQFSTFSNIFIRDEIETYCRLAPNFGYKEDCMRKAYSDFICSTAPRYILSIKAEGYIWKDEFWSKAFPLLKEFPKAWVTILPAAIAPTFFVKALRSIKRKLMH